MGGFRKAMPFTFGCFIVGGLALAGVPPFSGFFSKDEILAAVGSEGGWHIILAVLGYIVAFMTAVYTFRMIFRAFLGEAVPEARELEEGHLHHVDVHTNPVVRRGRGHRRRLPGPDHHIAEREPSMKVAMTGLAILTIIGGFIQIPWVDHVLETFLEPTFAGSVLLRVGAPVQRADRLRPRPRHDHRAQRASASRTSSGSSTRARRSASACGSSRSTRSRSTSGTSTRLIDFLIVRPAKRTGGIAGSVIERGFIDKGITGGASGAVRAGSAAVRAAQTGFLRYYAALVVVGMVAVTAYFLIQT